MFDEKLLNALTSRSNLRKLVLSMYSNLDVRLTDSESNRTAFDQLRSLEINLHFTDLERVLGKVSVNLQSLCLGHYGLEADPRRAEITSEAFKFVSDRFVSIPIAVSL